MWRGEREAFKILKQKVDPNAKYIWFHAASVSYTHLVAELIGCTQRETIVVLAAVHIAVVAILAFLTEILIASKNSWYAIPVSYTHLDVYKRQ